MGFMCINMPSWNRRAITEIIFGGHKAHPTAIHDRLKPVPTHDGANLDAPARGSAVTRQRANFRRWAKRSSVMSQSLVEVQSRVAIQRGACKPLGFQRPAYRSAAVLHRLVRKRRRQPALPCVAWPQCSATCATTNTIVWRLYRVRAYRRAADCRAAGVHAHET